MKYKKLLLTLYFSGLSIITQTMDENTQKIVKLVQAAYNGNINTVKQLLPLTNPNAFVSYSLTKLETFPKNLSLNALSAASYAKKTDIVVLLLHPENSTITPQEKIDVNAASPQGYSALFIAVDQDEYGIAKLLLESGANPNQKDNTFGDTPLHKAVQKNNSDMVKLLLEYKADKALKNKADNTPLDIAKSNKRTDIEELLKDNEQETIEEELPITEELEHEIIEDIEPEEKADDNATELIHALTMLHNSLSSLKETL